MIIRYIVIGLWGIFFVIFFGKVIWEMYGIILEWYDGIKEVKLKETKISNQIEPERVELNSEIFLDTLFDLKKIREEAFNLVEIKQQEQSNKWDGNKRLTRSIEL